MISRDLQDREQAGDDGDGDPHSNRSRRLAEKWSNKDELPFLSSNSASSPPPEMIAPPPRLAPGPKESLSG